MMHKIRTLGKLNFRCTIVEETYMVSSKAAKNIPVFFCEFKIDVGCLGYYGPNEIPRPDIIFGAEIIQDGLELSRVRKVMINRKNGTRFGSRIAVKCRCVKVRVLWIISK